MFGQWRLWTTKICTFHQHAVKIHVSFLSSIHNSYSEFDAQAATNPFGDHGMCHFAHFQIRWRSTRVSLGLRKRGKGYS